MAMQRDKYVSGPEQILKFYDSRGYRGSVGTGKRPAVVIIDFSNAFTRSASQFPGGNFAAELAQTRRLIEGARKHGIPVFYTTIAYADPQRDSGLWGRKVPWLIHCKTGTEAVDIDPDLHARLDEPVIVKKFPSAFFETDLRERLRALDIDTVIIAGCTTSVCVRATAIDAMQHHYHTLIAEEAVGDFDPALHAVHLRDVDARYADVVPVDHLLSYFRSLSGH
jgi:nicotinamidase-related amidase